MGALAERSTATRPVTAAVSTNPGRAQAGEHPAVASTLHLQRTIGNRAVQRLVVTKATEDEEDVPIRHVAAKADGSRHESRRLLAHELGGAVLQRQPVAPRPAPRVAPPAGRATLNFLPILQDQAPASWGITVFDVPVLDITVYESGATWKCVITTADQQTHQGVRLLPGVVEVTPALVAAERSCPTLNTMITSLNSVASQGPPSGYYMLAAVQAHEDEHVRQYRTGVPPHYTTLKAAVEALTVPKAGNTAASAKTAIKALPAFTAAMATFSAAELAVNNATAAHSPVAPFNTVEHRVVDPMVATIRARRAALACPP